MSVEYREHDGSIRGDQVKVVDFDNPWNNDWLAVNQFTVTESGHERRPDIVLFVNGLPLGVVELKNPADPDATVNSAWNQLQTYKSELPTLFSMNEAMIVSGGDNARMGTLTAGMEWFKPWRTISGETLADPLTLELQVLLEGACDPGRLLALVRDFIVFEDDGGPWSRRWRGTTSSTPSASPWTRPCAPPSSSRRMTSRNAVDATNLDADQAAGPETGESVWSGTRRDRARA